MKRIIIITTLLAARTALAQAPGEPAPPPPEPAPSPNPPPPPPPAPTPPGATDVGPAPTLTAGPILPNLLPTRLGTTIDARLDYTHFDNAGLDLDPLIGFLLHAQYLTAKGYGGYAELPYYYTGADIPNNNNKGIGNLEVGGLYVMKQGPNSELMLRGAIDLNSGGQSGGLLAPFTQLAVRLHDAYPTGFDTEWGRAAVSFHHSEGAIRLGAAVGFDLPFDNDGLNVDGLATLAVSVGVEQPGVGFAVGYVMLQAIGSDSDDDNISGLNLSADVSINPTMKVYAQFGLPDLENNLDEFDIWGVGAGLRVAVN